MKKSFYLFAALMLVISSSYAQAPQSSNYQAIARNSAGVALADQNISIQISITNGSGGTLLYQERHFPTTNQFGLFTLPIGLGAVITGTFTGINWPAVTPWMEVDMDPSGGTTFTNMGSTQLLSVPYALNALVADSALHTAGVSGSNGTVNYVSKFTGTNAIGNSSIFDNGNIGIGTTTPAYPLDVTGDSLYAGHFVNTAESMNASGLYGSCNTNADSGYGVMGYGGYVGVYGEASLFGNPFQPSSRYGLYGYGASGSNSNYGAYGHGSGFTCYGVYGQADNGGDCYGLYGYATGTTPYGVYGNAVGGNVTYSTIYGVYGSATAGSAPSQTLWAGYFASGNVYIQNNLGIGTATPARSLDVNAVMRLEPIAAAPSSPAQGDIYYDSSMNVLRVYDGATWHNLW